MTTQARYARPAGEQQRDVPGTFDTTFKWEYEDGRAALMTLYEKGKKATVRRHQQAWQLSQFLHGEQGALIRTAKIVQQVPNVDAKFMRS